jgi:hypothetical protein
MSVGELTPPIELPEPEVVEEVSVASEKVSSKSKVLKTLTAMGLGVTTLLGI